MYIIDSHIHLYLDEFSNDREKLIKNAENENIKKFLLPNIDLDSVEKMINLCKEHPKKCYPMLGLHPCYVDNNYEKKLSILENYLNTTKFIAIGEIGIDLHWDKTYLNEQKKAFKTQISWAKKYHLPVVIHCRNSFEEIYKILKEESDENLSGVLHCFGGNIDQARKLIDLNFFLGIGGVVTYKNSDLKSVLQQIPINKILIETDAPYLSPSPCRGKRNEPEFIKHTAQKICEIKNISMQELTNQLYKNTKSLFFNQNYLI
tara:strand:+ start:1304 stop:2086 length:783 start_codon:yes stop_codon:yes gene_type:complete